MRNLTIVDETFDINISSSYHLSVELNSAGISYAILDTIRKKYIALRSIKFDNPDSVSIEEQIWKLFQRDNYLNRKYKSSGLVYATPNATLIPEALYEEDRKEALFGFTNMLPAGNIILTNEIKSIDARVSFSIPAKLVNILEDHQGDFKILHQSVPFIENAVLAVRHHENKPKVVARIFPDFFDILVFREGKFELFNSFKYQTGQDLIFYILYVYEQFGLNPGQSEILLSGDVDENSDLITRLSQFVSNIKFDSLNRNFDYSYTFGQLSKHQFSNLINIITCV